MQLGGLRIEKRRYECQSLETKLFSVVASAFPVVFLRDSLPLGKTQFLILILLETTWSD